MNKFITVIGSAALLYSMQSAAVDPDAVLGGAIGGGVGAAVGGEIGGREGAIAGSAIGAAVGTAVATSDDNHDSGRKKVIYVEEHHRHGPPGHAYGHRVPPGHAKHRKHRY